MQRWPLRIAVLAGLALVAIFVAIRLAAIHVQTGDGASATDSSSLAVGVPVNGRPPAVTLLDARGRPASLAAFHGRWVVLAPTLTHCHEVCPITTGALLRVRALMRRTGAGERLAVAEVSVDPWRDSPARLRAYRRETGARMPIFTGDLATLRRFWKFFGVGFRRIPGDVQHTDGVFLIDPSGRERVAIPGMPGTGGRLSPRLRALLDRKGLGNLEHPTAPWTPEQVAEDLGVLMGLPSPADGGATPPSPRQARRALAGSPGRLAALHAQAGRLLPSDGLEARIDSLRGFPVVVNAWASWCPPCRGEMPLFSAASARYGRRVAFLGADVDDQSAAARDLLSEIPLSYPSYEASLSGSSILSPAPGPPVTVFIAPTGEIVNRHIGAYRTTSELDTDISSLLAG